MSETKKNPKLDFENVYFFIAVIFTNSVLISLKVGSEIIRVNFGNKTTFKEDHTVIKKKKVSTVVFLKLCYYYLVSRSKHIQKLSKEYRF